MKTSNKPAVSKLVARFDKELKNLLMNDLKAIREAKNNFLNNAKVAQLSAA